MTPPREHRTDNTLYEWDEIKDEVDWKGILLGNGASIAVWSKFSYNSLFEVATNNATGLEIENPISPEAQELFDKVNTTNFELVLRYYLAAKIVAEVHSQPGEDYRTSYDNVKNALIESAHAVHIAYSNVEGKLDDIKNELLNYSNIFSTNYDLIIYWALMMEKDKFSDFFLQRNGIFNPRKAELEVPENPDEERRLVHFLHGGLHLYRSTNGATRKRKRTDDESLLDIFGTPFEDDQSPWLPLFVSEGTSDDKLRTITFSQYLSFVFDKFREFSAPLVVFGHQLREDVDGHILDIVKELKDQPLAISIYAPGRNDIEGKKHAFLQHLSDNQNIFFFKAETHPLGLPELRVDPEEDA